MLLSEESVTQRVTLLVASIVDIEFKTRRLQRIFSSNTELIKKYGERMARTIQTRLEVLKSAPILAQVPTMRPVRCHPLKGRRKGYFAVDLVHPYRLMFRPDNTPLPLKPDGGIDITRVTAIQITEVVDYHN